jgi:hypothetical protein
MSGSDMSSSLSPSSRAIAPALRRRDLLAGSAALLAWAVLPRLARAADDDAALVAAKRSALIYVSPLRSDGSESRCHGEVWFVPEGRDLLVVTDATRWRAACIGKGLTLARIWVGDYGVWTRSGGAYREGPSYVARAAIDAATESHASALARFGEKYADEWDRWGPRFRAGLASGERVMIRYSPQT